MLTVDESVATILRGWLNCPDAKGAPIAYRRFLHAVHEAAVKNGLIDAVCQPTTVGADLLAAWPCKHATRAEVSRESVGHRTDRIKEVCSQCGEHITREHTAFGPDPDEKWDT